MPIPRRLLYGEIHDLNHQGMPGSKVVFTPVLMNTSGDVYQVNYIKDLDTDELLVGTHTVEARSDGYWEYPLPVTDSLLSDPTQFSWRATVFLGGGRLLTTMFELPTGVEPIPFADVVSAIPGEGTYRPLVTVAEVEALRTLVLAGGVGGAYKHVQTTPAATWTVVHGLGRCPAPTLIPTGTIHPEFTDVFYPDENTLVVEWDRPTSGIAYI